MYLKIQGWQNVPKGPWLTKNTKRSKVELLDGIPTSVTEEEKQEEEDKLDF